MKKRKEKNSIFTKFIPRTLVKWVMIPLLLLFLWLALSVFYSSYQSLTVLQYAHNLSSQDNFNVKKLYKNKSITGTFKAQENHLGIIAIRFGDIPKVDYNKEDVVIFRLKEVGSTKWLYENKYRSGAITPDEYFPMGFSQVDNSYGKTYKFEITSTTGNNVNAIQISQQDPVYITKYKFSKSEIFGSFKSIIIFILKKLTTFFTNYELVLASTVFLLPFIFYMLWVLFIFKTYRKVGGRKVFQFIVAVLILSDVIFYSLINTGLMLGLLGLWLISIHLNKTKSSVSFIIAFFLICISILGIYFGANISINKACTFAYLFIVIGFIQNIFEYKNQNKK